MKFIRVPAAKSSGDVASMSVPPSGTMSAIEAGACLMPRRPSQVPSLARSNSGWRRPGSAVGVSVRAAQSAFPASMTGWTFCGYQNHEHRLALDHDAIADQLWLSL